MSDSSHHMCHSKCQQWRDNVSGQHRCRIQRAMFCLMQWWFYRQRIVDDVRKWWWPWTNICMSRLEKTCTIFRWLSYWNKWYLYFRANVCLHLLWNALMLLAITCAIPNIDNGAITCQDSTVAEYNEQCSVSCNDGFIGNASAVTCENSGDLEPTTVCQGQ